MDDGVPVPAGHHFQIGLAEGGRRRKRQMAGVRNVLVHLDGEAGGNRQVQIVLDGGLRVGGQPGAERFVLGSLLPGCSRDSLMVRVSELIFRRLLIWNRHPGTRVAALNRGRPVPGGLFGEDPDLRVFISCRRQALDDNRQGR